jgi:glycosyltransferase involved in cell wall biosynthesis
MNKVFVLPPSEDWIVDRFVKEWSEDNIDILVNDPRNADVIWLLADWAWAQLISTGLLTKKKVLTTVHHIVPEKFSSAALRDFMLRDSITTAYHVYNEKTLEFIGKLTQKPVHVIPYWANQKIWRPTGDKLGLRLQHGLPQDAYLVGSFQRDTEGHDLISPKLEKGPDLLADYLESLSKKRSDIHVVLAGWRRQYIIKRLNSAGIPYTYFERPPHEVINDLYQTLDLYPVTARCEGGPQSLIECGLLNVPVISRDVGIANQVLPQASINNDLLVAAPAVPNVESWKLPNGYSRYRDLILGL